MTEKDVPSASMEEADGTMHPEKPVFPLIVFVLSQGKNASMKALADRCASRFPGYLINRERWFHTSAPAIAQLLGSTPEVQVGPLVRRAVRAQSSRQPTLLALHGCPVDGQAMLLLKDADLIVHIRASTKEVLPDFGQMRVLPVVMGDGNAEVSIITAIRAVLPQTGYTTAIEGNEQDHTVIRIPELADAAGVPFTESPERGRQYSWGIAHMEPALQHLRERIGSSTKPIHIDGVCPAFLACAIATAFPGNGILVSDPKIPGGKIAIPDRDSAGKPPASVADPQAALLQFTPEERDGYTFMDISIPGGVFPTTEENLRTIRLPEVAPGHGVVLSGRLSLVLFVTLARAFQRNGAAWVAPHTPQQAEDAEMVSPAMKICGGEIEYIDVFPYYIETFPIGAIEKTLQKIQEELADDHDPLFETLRGRMKERYDALRSAKPANSADYELLFRTYARLLSAAHEVLDGIGVRFAAHGITDRDATKNLLAEAIRILTEPTDDAARMATVRERLHAMQTDIVAFGNIMHRVYALSGRRIGVAEVPELSLQVIGVCADAGTSGDDPAALLDHPQAEALWARIRQIYDESYGKDLQHRDNLLRNFPKYLQPSLRPAFHVLSYSAAGVHRGDPRDVVGFARFTDIRSKDPNDTRTYRYAGALNVEKRFQGFQMYVPFLNHCFAKEFLENGCDVLVFRAEPKVAKIYARTLGAEETQQEFDGEFPSGDPSVLMTLSREKFLELNPHYLDPASSS